MNVFVAGVTGTIGQPLARALKGAGHTVVGMTRSEAKASVLQALGVTPVVCDCLDSERLMGVVADAKPDAVIHQVTSIPRNINPRRIRQEFVQTNRLRRDGTRNLLAAAVDAGARLFLAQSIAFAYKPGGSGLRRETDPLDEHTRMASGELVQAVATLERTVLEEKRLNGIVLRYGFFYGPGTVYAVDGSFSGAVLKRAMPILGRGQGTFSFIHVEDAAAATLLALEKEAPEIYNIVDDEPAPVAEWLPEFARIIGARKPYAVPTLLGRLVAGAYAASMMTLMPGASNEKARSDLGWIPRYPSWRTGFRLARG